MKRILVIGSSKKDTNETAVVEAMAAYSHKAIGSDIVSRADFCHLDEIGYVIQNDSVQLFNMRDSLDLSEYDLVWFRGKLASAINIAATASQYLQAKGIPTVNTAYANRRAVGKIAQMCQLVDMNLPIPKTVSASVKYLPDLIEKHLSYPAIVKDVKGAHGNNNYLVASKDELLSILHGNEHMDFMAQEFIENDGDYRVLLVGNQTMIIKRKGIDGSHLNNTSQGATASIIPLDEFPAEVVRDARIFAKACEYEIAGVDVIFDKNTNKHYFLEINSQPQLASGVFLDEKSAMLGTYFRNLLSS
ncbi:MAG: ATP-grasp domain-containing protein [Patescibacteria group bacterium]|nr:ATP-grasp domain-containing protein [Patescibacteria group bacterium]